MRREWLFLRGNQRRARHSQDWRKMKSKKRKESSRTVMY